MKKVFLSIVSLILLAVVSLSSCGKEPGESEKTVYDTLNEWVNAGSESLTVTVSSTQNRETLESRYQITKNGNRTTVTYSFEELSAFAIGAGGITTQDAYKTTKTGSVVVADGKIVERNGDPVDISVESVSLPAFCFDEKYFENVTDDGNTLTAKVDDIASFCGWQSQVSDMNVTVNYSATAIRSIDLSYRSASQAEVTVRYQFG